jgi:hypothetical protein
MLRARLIDVCKKALAAGAKIVLTATLTDAVECSTLQELRELATEQGGDINSDFSIRVDGFSSTTAFFVVKHHVVLKGSEIARTIQKHDVCDGYLQVAFTDQPTLEDAREKAHGLLRTLLEGRDVCLHCLFDDSFTLTV